MDPLDEVLADAYPACPGCGERLQDAGPDERPRLRCETCGLDVVAG